jgi:uncharacterized protein (DUF2336 family)
MSMSVPDRKQAPGGEPHVDRLLAEAAGAAEASRARIGAAVIDLTTPRGSRISATTRMDLARLLAALVVAIEDDLRHRLITLWGDTVPASLITSLSASSLPIAAPILDRARVLGDADLIATLLCRVEAHRLADRMRPPEAPALPILESFMRSGDEPLAARAMALLTARSRRSNDLDAPTVAVTDLPAELQHRLAWRIAAALRHHVLAVGAVSAADADRALAAVVPAMLAGYDEDDSLEGRAMQVARRLHQRRRLDDALVGRAFAEGEVTLAGAMLAVRAGIDLVAAWEMIADTGGSRLTLLLRATGIGRAVAATILRDLAAAGVGSADLIERLDGFDRLDPLAARDALRLWQCDPGYRRAITELADGLASGGGR